MNKADVEIAIVGGGVAGLAAGLECRHQNKQCIVFESNLEVGGALQSETKDGYCFERGANAFRIPEELAAWLSVNGLHNDLIPAGSESKYRAVFFKEGLIWLPQSLAGVVVTPLLSPKGKCRVLADFFIPDGSKDEENVANFITRRFGVEALYRAVAPFLTGIYAGDESFLGAEAVFPALRDYERRYGSVLRGVLANSLRARKNRMKGSYGGRYGLGKWAQGIGQRLDDSLWLGNTVNSISMNGSLWCLEVMPKGEMIKAKSVILALPSREAARLLAPLDRETMKLLQRIKYAPIVNVQFGFGQADTREPIRGFGYLISREAKIELLGALFPSRVFPDRAPLGSELVSAMIGGVRWPGVLDTDDAGILSRAREGLDATLGLRGDGTVLNISRWPKAVPQPDVAHPKIVQTIHSRLNKHLPGLDLAGSYLSGVGIGDTMLSGIKAVRRLE